MTYGRHLILICCAETCPPMKPSVFRKMLAEWSDGDENGFPVQLALLTRAQWRAAALRAAGGQ